MDFKDKIAVVTGGSSGIGESTVNVLEKFGAQVINLDIVKPKNSSSKVEFIELDVTQEKNVTRIISQIVTNYAKIDVLVNSAGVTARNALDGNYTEYDLWKKVIDVNLNGTYLVCREVIKSMMVSESGCIVNLSSIMGQIVYPEILNTVTSPYPISKGGVLQYTKNLASLLADKGIRVNCVSPAFIMTDLTKNILNDNVIGPELKHRTPMKRFGNPEEVANVIAFLSSDYSSYITGADIPVDGGYLIL
tara:strand:- start:893 stop:1636 length:744 start_codon:yes stop_codon:yes gene_type:complete